MPSTIARRPLNHAKVDIGRPSRGVPVCQDLLIDLRSACDEIRSTNAAVVESTMLHQHAVANLQRVLDRIVTDANRRQGRRAA